MREGYLRQGGGQYLMIGATRSFLGGRGIGTIERQRMSDNVDLASEGSGSLEFVFGGGDA